MGDRRKSNYRKLNRNDDMAWFQNNLRAMIRGLKGCADFVEKLVKVIAGGNADSVGVRKDLVKKDLVRISDIMIWDKLVKEQVRILGMILGAEANLLGVVKLLELEEEVDDGK